MFPVICWWDRLELPTVSIAARFGKGCALVRPGCARAEMDKIGSDGHNDKCRR